MHRKEIDKPKEVEKPECKLVGENGNVFNLMGLASRALKKAGLKDQAKEMQNRIMGGPLPGAKSYNEALCIIMEYVDVY